MSEPVLATRYLGLPLSGPIIASAGPLTGRLDTLKQLEASGAAAVVLPSLFEEEVVAEELHLSDMIDEGDHFAEFSGGVLPEVDMPELGVGHHLRLVEQAKAAVSVPVIASLNATHHGSWERYAAMMVEAGADALELNLYAVAADPNETSTEVEARALDVIAAVAASVTVPLAVKLSPFYSALAHFAAAAVRQGADGLVLFNRFYAPDIDLGALDVVPRVELSSPADLRMPLRWLGILRSQLPVGAGLACTSGIHSGTDAAKALLVGADVACTTSAVLRHGPEYVATMLTQLRDWLTENDYESIDQLRGSMSATSVLDPSAFERSQYMAVITSMRDRV